MLRWRTSRQQEIVIRQIIEAFGFGRAQDFSNLIVTLESSGISIHQFLRFVEKIQNGSEPKPKSSVIPPPPRLALKRKCPVCRMWLGIYKVNDSPCRQVGGKLKSQWLCHNCGWEEFSEVDIDTEAKPYIKEV